MDKQHFSVFLVCTACELRYIHFMKDTTFTTLKLYPSTQSFRCPDCYNPTFYYAIVEVAPSPPIIDASPRQAAAVPPEQ